jgi:hypothetical protein
MFYDCAPKEKKNGSIDVHPLLDEIRTCIETTLEDERAAREVMFETLRNHVDHLRSKDVYVIKSMAQVDDDQCAYGHIIFYLLFAHF